MDQSDIETALRLTPHFYPAAIDFDAWPNVLEQLNEVFGTVIAQVTLANFQTQDLIATANSGLTKEMLEAWLGLPDHLSLDPRVPYAIRMRNMPFCERDVMSVDQWHGSRFYKVLMQRFGLDSAVGALIDIDEERGIFAGLKVIRRSSDPPFTPEDIERFHLYLPHFREAMRCAARITRAEARSTVFADIFDRLRVAALVTDRFAAIRYRNEAAEALLSRRNGLSVTHGKVMGLTGAASDLLHRKILKVLAGGSAGAAQKSLLRLPRPGHDRDLLVSIAPVGGVGFDRVSHQMLAALFVLDPERRYEGDAEALQRLFGLTGIEADVMVRVATGNSARQVAQDLGRAYETVRSHLKTVYGKTGARSQADLVGLVHRVAAPMATRRPESDALEP